MINEQEIKQMQQQIAELKADLITIGVRDSIDREEELRKRGFYVTSEDMYECIESQIGFYKKPFEEYLGIEMQDVYPEGCAQDGSDCDDCDDEDCEGSVEKYVKITEEL